MKLHILFTCLFLTSTLFSIENVHKLIIIGSGPAGLTAGIYAGRAQLTPLIFEGQEPGGKLIGTSYIENWPSEKHILGSALMETIREHAELSGCTLSPSTVVRVDLSSQPFTVWTDFDEVYQTESLIIATGSHPRKIGCPGEDTYWGAGVSSCVTCDGAFFKDKKVVVVGGGDSGMEYASALSKYTKNITIVQDLPMLTASAPMQQRILSKPYITVIYNSLISEMRGDGQKLTTIEIFNQKTKEKTILETDGIFLAIGHIPATQIFREQLKMDRFGHLLINDKGQTSVKGIFAAGDAIDGRYRQAIYAAGSGCKVAMEVENYLISTQKHRYKFAKNPF